jgi:RNA polymerase sigma-70 factor (ECF subfamily)
VPKDATEILKNLSDGRPDAAEQLFPLVYDELRALAARCLRRERADHTLQPTALVHEAYLKLVDQAAVAGKGREHFVGIAARAMRQVLVDHARRHSAAKRGGGRRRIMLDSSVASEKQDPVDLLALDEALERLSALDERQGRIVELRFFGGLTTKEAAELLGVSLSTVEADWRMARAWLHRALECE